MATEKRLIDVNDVYALFDKNGFARLHVGDIDTIPRVDAVEVVHGRTFQVKEPHHILMDRECENCQCLMLITDNYCPNCGAKMDL